MNDGFEDEVRVIKLVAS